MRKLPEPIIDLASLFHRCVDGKHEPARSHLLNMREYILGLERSYIIAARSGSIHCFPKQTHSVTYNDAIKLELNKLYDERFVKKSTPGRVIYDSILIAGNPRCPYCNHNKPRQLDHVLPKGIEEYPELSIVPPNLVPSCGACNYFKLSYTATGIGEQFFHPYFEDIAYLDWLIADTRYSTRGEVTIEYKTRSIEDHPILSNRIKFQFDKLELDALYEAQAATRITDLKFELGELYRLGGASQVQARLHENCESCAQADKNSWQTALLRCLANDMRFCEMNWIL